MKTRSMLTTIADMPPCARAAVNPPITATKPIDHVPNIPPTTPVENADNRRKQQKNQQTEDRDHQGDEQDHESRERPHANPGNREVGFDEADISG